MILGLRLKNWKSFREETIFTAYASGIRQCREHIAIVSKQKARVLPVGMIFGGNASGKSNFVAAISFLQRFVTDATFSRANFYNVSFLFSTVTKTEPTEIGIQFASNNIIYDFSVSFNKESVLHEKLAIVHAAGETILYERSLDKIEFLRSYRGNELARLNFAAQGTKPGQLFLSNSIGQNVETFSEVYNWFSNELVVIGPDYSLDSSIFLSVPDLANFLGEKLKAFDTGISGVTFSPVKISELNLPPDLIERLYSLVKTGDKTAHYTLNGSYLVFSWEKDGLTANRVVAKHLDENSDEVPIAFEDESDGTRRLFDLLPAFSMLDGKDSQKVVVIDELDRSLHTKLSQRLIQAFLSTRTPESRSQLLFTTHDMMLLDQSKFRRDEIWIVEKNDMGSSNMICLSDFNIRYDLDIRKAYLDGRFEDRPYLKNLGGHLGTI